MHITKVFHTITQSNPQDDWQRFDYRQTERAVFKGDVNLRIESHLENDLENDDFQEEWANKHPDKNAKSYRYNIYYGATLVANVILVSVDGARALLPLPEFQTLTPDLLTFRVAEIMDCKGVHEYMGRAGLKYPEGA